MDLHLSSTFRRRWSGAAGLAAIAAVHIDIAPQHLREAPYAGVLFSLLAAAALVSAFVLLITDHPLAWAGAATLCLGAVGAYLVSRSIGLPSLGDDIGDWLNPLGIVAVLCETAVVALAAPVLGAARAYRTVTATERLYTVVPASPIDPAG